MNRWIAIGIGAMFALSGCGGQGQPAAGGAAGASPAAEARGAAGAGAGQAGAAGAGAGQADAGGAGASEAGAAGAGAGQADAGGAGAGQAVAAGAGASEAGAAGAGASEADAAGAGAAGAGASQAGVAGAGPAAQPAEPVPQAPAPAAAPTANAVTVAITGDSKRGVILKEASVPVKGEMTVIDVLKQVTKANKLQMEYQGKGAYAYVQGIDNLYEFDEGPKSGWVYKVNGRAPGEGAGSYKVKAGDKIEWLYTLNLGEDVGAKPE